MDTRKVQNRHHSRKTAHHKEQHCCDPGEAKRCSRLSYRVSTVIVSLSDEPAFCAYSSTYYSLTYVRSSLGRVELRLDRISLVTQDVLQKQESLEARIKDIVQESVQTSTITHASSSAVSDHAVIATTTTTKEQRTYVEIHATQFERRICDKWCKCTCHKKKEWASPYILSKLFGHLLVGYVGYVSPHQQCSRQACREKSGLHTRIAYQFPSWFLLGRVSLMLSNNHQGPELLLRWHRVRPYGETDLFRFATQGNIKGIQDLFSRRVASPFDIQPDGRNALHVTIHPNFIG